MSATAVRLRSWLCRLLTVVALAAGLSGCAPDGDQAASKQLGRLQQALYNEALLDFRRGFDPVVLARWASNDSGPYRSGDGQQFDQRVAALSWSSEDGMDGRVDLRLTVTTPGFRSSSFGQDSYGPGSAERCVQIRVGAAGDDSVVPVDCAGRPAAVVPPEPPPPAPLSRTALAKAMSKPSLREADCGPVGFVRGPG